VKSYLTPTGALRLHHSVTAAAAERVDRDAVLRGLADLIGALPEAVQPIRLWIDYERDRRGRRAESRATSRRVFLTLIAE